MTSFQIKLQTALIEIGKEAEKLKGTPTASNMAKALIQLDKAIQAGDLVKIRRHSRELCAMVVKMMVEKL